MMTTRRITTIATTGTNVYAIVQRLSDGKVFDWADSSWKTFAAPPTTPGIALTSLASYGGSQSLFGADLNMSTVNNTVTPVDVQVIFQKRAGGSPAPATDTVLAVADPFTIVLGTEQSGLGGSGYTVDCTVTVTTTAGTNAHVKAQLRDAAGALVDLDGVSATCAVDVQRDGVHTQFSLSTTDFGSPNANGWFEADYANPNFTTDVGYTGLATIVVGGVTYTGLCNFVVWP
jgi:hypothetical protein